MALLAGLVVSWLLIACAAAWMVGKAARVGGPVREALLPAPKSPRARSPYAGRKVRRPAAAAPARHRASPSSYRVSSRVAGRSVH